MKEKYRLLYTLLFLIIFLRVFPQRISAATRVPILLYHDIRDCNCPNHKVGIGLSVSPALFDQEMGYLGGLGTWYGNASFGSMDMPRVRINGNISLQTFAARL